MDIKMLMLFMDFAKKLVSEDALAQKQVGRRSAEVAAIW